MQQRLALPPLEADALPMNVILRTDDGPVSLLVDEIGDVVEVPPGTFEPSPDIVDEGVRQLVIGAHKLEGRLLLVLDTARVVAPEGD